MERSRDIFSHIAAASAVVFVVIQKRFNRNYTFIPNAVVISVYTEFFIKLALLPAFIVMVPKNSFSKFTLCKL